MKKPNYDDIAIFFEFGVHLPSRTLFMSEHEGTEHTMVEKTVKALHLLDVVVAPLTIITNNPGGDSYHGIAIFDAIRAAKSHVTIVVFGMAMSMGSVILQAADHRVMSRNSVQMIHYGSRFADGEARTVSKWARESDRLDRWMEQMYLEKLQEKWPNYSLEELQKMLDRDTFLTAEQSLSMGLCDEVI